MIGLDESGNNHSPGSLGEGVCIDRMHPSDLQTVIRLEQASFSAPWPDESFELILGDPSLLAMVARKARDPIAYTVGSLHGRELLVANLAVAGPFRGKGIGRRLLEALLEEGRRRGAEYAVLDVRASNEAAVRLYESMGFRTIGRREGYYSSPREDSLVMLKRFR